jgi:hypothetical protein
MGFKFGFRKNHQTDLRQRLRADLLLPEGVTLVSKEDIYTPDRSTLLLKAGQSVETDQLPKLIRFGVQPNQFHFEKRDTEGATSPMSPPAWPGRLNKNQKILVLEPDDKHRERMTDCLMTCGIPLSRIHPVRAGEHLAWAIKKYQPEMLFMTFPATPSMLDYHQLDELRTQKVLKRIVLMISAPMEGPKQQEALVEAARARGAEVIFKPIHRFAIKTLLTTSSTKSL